jgi:hypothetical protein
MMSRKTFFASLIGLALTVILLVACGTPEPTAKVIGPISTSAPAPATPTQAPPPTETPVPEPSPSDSVLSKPTRHALFLQAWMFINDRYVYPDYGGRDWEAVRDESSEKVANAASDEEFYDLMREMVELLGDDHSSFIAADLVALDNAVYENLEIPVNAIRLRSQVYTPEAMVSQFDAGLHEALESCLGPFPGPRAGDRESHCQLARRLRCLTISRHSSLPTLSKCKRALTCPIPYFQV